MFTFSAQSKDVSDVMLMLLGNILYNADLSYINNAMVNHHSTTPAAAAQLQGGRSGRQRRMTPLPPQGRRAPRPTVCVLVVVVGCHGLYKQVAPRSELH